MRRSPGTAPSPQRQGLSGQSVLSLAMQNSVLTAQSEEEPQREVQPAFRGGSAPLVPFQHSLRLPSFLHPSLAASSRLCQRQRRSQAQAVARPGTAFLDHARAAPALAQRGPAGGPAQRSPQNSPWWLLSQEQNGRPQTVFKGF